MMRCYIFRMTDHLGNEVIITFVVIEKMSYCFVIFITEANVFPFFFFLFMYDCARMRLFTFLVSCFIHFVKRIEIISCGRGVELEKLVLRGGACVRYLSASGFC